MKELDAQRLIIDIVRDHGGAAFKLSTRFLVGVSDLLIKLPLLPALLLEVKVDKMPVKSAAVNLAVTGPQQRFLTQFGQAGMCVGVMSLIERSSAFGAWVGIDKSVRLNRYRIGHKSERRDLIWEVLNNYLEEHRS